MRRLHDHLDAWIPADLDAETRRRLFLTIGFAVPGAIALVFFGAANAVANPQAGLVLACMALPLALVPVVVRFSRWPSAGGHMYLAVVLATLMAAAQAKGGLASSVTGWLPGMAFVAVLVLGTRAARIWLVIVGAAHLVLAGLAEAWPEALGSVWVYAASRIGALVMSFWLAWLFESARNRAYTALEVRRQAIRQLLDHADQGFLSIRADGTMGSEVSAIVTRWLGERPEDGNLVTWVGQVDAEAASWLQLGLESVVDDILPVEVSLAQLPERVQVGERTLSLVVRPMRDGITFLVVLSDVTDVLARAAAEEGERETARLVEHVTQDRSGVLTFAREADGLVTRLEQGVSRTVALRVLHTLKGNAALFDLSSVAGFAHELESRCFERADQPHPNEVTELRARLDRILVRLGPFLGDENHVDVPLEELRAIEQAASARRAHHEIAEMVAQLRYEPARRVLERVGRGASALAERLGKVCQVEILDEAEVRLPPERWAPVFAALPHVVRNALDHGLEMPEERLQAGKTSCGRLTLSVAVEGNEVVLVIEDDGRGIDWDRIRLLADQRGLPATTEEDLVAALFSDGLTTRTEATELSGRGVGTAAVRQAIQGIGGEVRVESEPGRGTRFVFRAPRLGVLAA